MSDLGVHLVNGQVDEVAERLARKNALASRPGSGPKRVSEHSKLSENDTTYWFIHISRLSIRIMIQSAHGAGRDLSTHDSWQYMDRQWMEGVRRFASRIAELRCERDEPDEWAKYGEIPASSRTDRATFLRRYFPVPAPGQCGPESWSIPELRLIGTRMAHSVDLESTEYPHHPDGWKETATKMKVKK